MTEIVIIDIDSENELSRFDASTGPFTVKTPTTSDEVKLPTLSNPGPYRVIHRRFVTDGVNEIRLYVRKLGV